jgi:hypothetical protein
MTELSRDEILRLAAEAQKRVEEAEAQRDMALELRRLAFLAAKEVQASNRAIGSVARISHQRVAKVVDGNAPVKNPRKQPEPEPLRWIDL